MLVMLVLVCSLTTKYGPAYCPVRFRLRQKKSRLGKREDLYYYIRDF